MERNSWKALLLVGIWMTLAAAAEPPAPLSLQEARAVALRQHPQISIAELRALAAQ